jgi:uncharacterized RDD family membrane protein YckC
MPEPASPQSLFEEAKAETTDGSGSISMPGSASAGPESEKVQPGTATGSGSLPKPPPAGEVKTEPEPEAASGSISKNLQTPSAGSGTMPKAESGPDIFSGSIITAEVVETTAGSKPTPQGEPGTRPAVQKPAAPEVPSFDDSAESKVGTEAELGELSEFFKDAKQKSPSPAPAFRPAAAKSARPVPAPPPPTVKEPLEFQDQEPDEGGVIREEQDAGSEDSMSRIKIKSGSDPSHPSEFNPDFAQPVFPDFSSSGSEAGKSESVSEVSRPLAASTSSVLLSGVLDLVLYLVIAGLFSLAGMWAAKISLSTPTLDFIVPLLIVLLLVVWFYQVFFLAVLGQTPGQMLTGIQLLDKTGNRISLARASLRAVVYILCLLPLGLGFIPSLFGSSLPDKAGQTKPVRW